MVEIKLANKKDPEYKYDCTINVSNESYLTDFDKITYSIEYKENIKDWLSSWKTSYTFHVYIINHKGQIIFTYNAKKANHEVKKVEAYYSTKHDKVPLVIGFFRKDPNKFTYYTYSFLKACVSHRGLPKNQFYETQLEQKLKAEDDRVNRIKFLNTNGNQKNCYEKRTDIDGKFKHCYNAEHQNRYEDHVLTKRQIFSHEHNIDVHESFFSSINDHYYDEVCVYRTNESQSKILVLEFINGGNKMYFVRQDKHGYYWITKPISDLKDELNQIDNECRNKLVYLIGRKGDYNGVNVENKSSNTSFDKYQHTPDGASSNQTGLLLCNGSSLVLEKNEEFRGGKIGNIQKLTLSSVCVHFIQGLSDTSPLFIQLTEKSGSNHWLQKVDPNCLLWKQIDDPQLGNAITYRLEVKTPNILYGNNTIKISPLSDSNFKAYSHKVQSEHDFKKSYATYRTSLISLERINDISTDQRLDKIQEKKLSSVSVYYKKEESDGPPMFLELTEYSTKKKYCLLKIDMEGLRWKQLDNESARITVKDKREKIIKEAKYYTTKSITILSNNNNVEYPVNLVDNSISGIVTPETPIQTTNKITVKNDKNSLSDLKYSCYEHSLTQTTEPESPQTQSPQTTTPDFLTQVSGLRIFIGSGTTDNVDLGKSVEIKLYSHDGNERKYLYYDSSSTNEQDTERKNKVYCYFYGEDNVPLMIYGDGFFYRPKSKDEYFQKWVQIQGISSFIDKPTVATKLKEINKELNLIDLVNTKSYGLPDPDSGQLPQDFSKDRITVTTETPNNLFLKVVHSTKNNGPVGKICYGGSELKVLSGEQTSGNGTPISNQVNNDKYNTVTSYYHNSDITFKTILLIEIFSATSTTVRTGTPTKLFYQRIDKNDNLKWTRIESHDSGQFSNNTKLAEKINKLHYDFNYSVKIKLENQGSSGIDNYDLDLVKNIGNHILKLPSLDNKITSNKYDCLTATSYTCYQHSITLGNTTPSDIGGLRFYIHDHEITFSNSLTSLGKLFIYFNHNNFQVHVYFYTDGSTTDKVPLLVGYDGKYYGPKSKDDYFGKWEEKTNIKNLPTDLTQKLTEINRGLNEVNISETKAGFSYGLKKPHPPNGIDDDFCNRINVKQEDKNLYYKKLVHNTTNKGPIGKVLYNGKHIQEINVNSLHNTCNQVCVYYHTSDTGYSRPLLLCIGSQNSFDSCVTWYYRQNVEGTQWKEDETKKYNSDNNIRDQLQLIQSRDSNFLNVQLDVQENNYPGCIIKGGYQGKKQEISKINIDHLFVIDTYRVDNYRCFEHKLYDYYSVNKDIFNTQLSLGKDPTLELSMNITNIKIPLHDTEGKLTSLYYTNQMATTNTSFFVYFYEPKGFSDYDKVPLLFIFGQLFFVPTSKQDYFKQWKQVELNFFRVIGNIDPKKNLGAKLNQITRLFNQINLQTTDHDYGEIELTQGTDTLKASPRVNVKRVIDTSYNSVTHSTEKTGCIGNVIFNTQNVMVVEGDQGSSGKTMLEDMELELEKSPTTIYNALTAYYHHSDTKLHKPLLIGISGADVSSELFYQRVDFNNNLNWKKIISTENLRTIGSGIEEKVNQIFYNFTSSVKIKLEQLLRNGGSTSYLAKLVTNDKTGTTESGGIGVNVAKDHCKLDPNYTCIKHTVSMNSDFSSQVGGLRFHFDNQEVQTYDSGGKTTMPVFYQQKKNYVYVYFHNTGEKMDTVPLLFKYNSQCFRPLNKTNYFTKWVYDSSISGTRHPQPSTLTQIATMLNEIQLDNTGQTGGSGQQYGLTVPGDVGTLTGFNENRITATRTLGDKFGKVVHATIDKLGIGPVKYNGKDVTDNSTSSKNLAESVRTDSSLARTVVNQVTVYYHTDDVGFTTPLMLGFASTNGGVGPETSATTPKVFYERVDSNKMPVKWSKIGLTDTTKLVQTDNQDKIAQKLQEIRYNIGKSVVITLTTQVNSGAESASPTEYPVQVVENKGSSAGRPTDAGVSTKKITVEKCEGTDSQPTIKGYTCYDHKIPALTGATESQYIGGVKFYACSKYLETFGSGGYPSEPIYYNSGQQTVTVYFYSNGHGPPDPDQVPLLVQYGIRYYRPSSRFSYFTSWVATQVQAEGVSTEGQGEKALPTVLDGINKELNAIDLGQTGTGTSGTASGYGIYPNDGQMCSCSIDNFCNRVSAQRDTKDVANYRKVTHTTTNKGGIGPVCYAGQVIKAIDTAKAGPNSVCNQVEVYYASDDNDCKNPLLVCLGQQVVGQTTDIAATTTKCKKWFKRNGIDITDWVEDGGEDVTTKYGTNESIQKELQSILSVFNDYLFLEIEKHEANYDVFVQAKTGPKQKVERTGGGGGAGGASDTTKIKVEATTGAGSETQVPSDYKAYTHGLAAFYKGAKGPIREALKKSLATNEVEQQDPTLYLRLQVAEQVLTLFKEGGENPLANPLKYGPSQAAGTTHDPYVYFFAGNSGAGSSNPDWVPLLFKFGTQYFGPKDRESYFHRWCEYEITGSGDALKQNLDKINRQLNEIDLTQTGTGTSRQHEYGLVAGSGVSLTRFKTARITVTRDDNPVMSSGTSSYVTVTHTTTNGFHIGSIKDLGNCKFDNKHTQELAKQSTAHNQAVAVYVGVGASTTGTLGTPSLVFIAESKRGLGTSSTSTVLGYYNLSGGCTSGQITFQKVKTTFTVGELTNRESIKGDSGLVTILTKLNIVAQEIKAQAALPDSAHGSEGQDDRPKAGVGAPDGDDALGDSGGMGEGEDGQAGKEGLSGQEGDTVTQHQQESKVQEQHVKQQQQESQVPEVNGHGTQSQEHTNHGGDGTNDGQGRGVSGPQGGKGENGDRGEASAMASDTGSSVSGDTLQQIMDVIKKPEVYGSASAVGGVGVIGGVGAVVYKN